MKLFKKLFPKKVKLDDQLLTDKLIVSELKENKNLFTCHYCHTQFEVKDKDIFPTSVKLLYKDHYIQGKGVLCPKCKQVCIFG